MDELWLSYGIWIKTAGILCTGAGAAGIGISMGSRFRDRLKLLEELQRAVSLLKGEILYANEPLKEAFSHIGQRKDSPVGVFFLGIAERMETGEGGSFYDMWQPQVDELERGLPLTEEDKRQLKTFGEDLGYLDHRMQERTIRLYQDQLENEIAYLRVHLQEKDRLYTSLGIAAGLFLVIVMC